MYHKTSTFSRSNHRDWQEGPIAIKNLQRHFSRSWRTLAKKDNEFQREVARNFKAAIWQAFF